jgi:threonylcarbamoyladenosine tRNA methylthiotransferase MtaB
MHIFKYSPRKGTKAAEIKEQIHGNVKEERSHKLITLNNMLEKKFMNRFVNRNMKVLYEQRLNDKQEFEGYTDNYIKVIAKSSKNIEGQFHITKLKECAENHIIGEV